MYESTLTRKAARARLTFNSSLSTMIRWLCNQFLRSQTCERIKCSRKCPLISHTWASRCQVNNRISWDQNLAPRSIGKHQETSTLSFRKPLRTSISQKQLRRDITRPQAKSRIKSLLITRRSKLRHIQQVKPNPSNQHSNEKTPERPAEMLHQKLSVQTFVSLTYPLSTSAPQSRIIRRRDRARPREATCPRALRSLAGKTRLKTEPNLTLESACFQAVMPLKTRQPTFSVRHARITTWKICWGVPGRLQRMRNNRSCKTRKVSSTTSLSAQVKVMSSAWFRRSHLLLQSSSLCLSGSLWPKFQDTSSQLESKKRRGVELAPSPQLLQLPKPPKSD